MNKFYSRKEKDIGFKKNLTAQEVYHFFLHALEEVIIPPDQRILNDAELCKILHISKRTSATWRASPMLAYHKVGGIIFYLYSDVLHLMNTNRIEKYEMRI